jgi:uncharacterized membrane protein
MPKNSSLPSPSPVQHFVSWLLAIGWCCVVMAMSSRDYFLVNYGSMRGVDAWLEPFVASASSSLAAFLTMVLWCAWRHRTVRTNLRSAQRSTVYLAISLVSLLVWIGSWAAESVGYQSLWPVFWLSAWTGLSFAELAKGTFASGTGVFIFGKDLTLLSRRSSFVVLLTASLGCGLWWTWQSWDSYAAYMLGFNDFGHFMQRVANTAAGRGVLLETPVLPMFWDHFNPGLLLLVPLWLVYPDASLSFVLQSVSLVAGSLCLWRLSLAMGHTAWVAMLWGMAWLSQPVLGQMNLAYSYGWHPISLAIPLMLLSLVYLTERKPIRACVALVFALSMEEGVFVVASLFCAASGMIAWKRSAHDSESAWHVVTALHARTWLITSLVLAIGFVVVFRYSGLAEFQTARFASLGGSPMQVLLSPVLRPAAFWGQLVREQTVYFLLGLLLPCFVPAWIRGWRWMLAAVLPLGVLLVWEHRPAQSLAFQYASTLLPIFWIASTSGASLNTSAQGRWLADFQFGDMGAAVGALATSLVLSIFLGQMPWSARTLTDVATKTYPPTEMGPRLQIGSPENAFLNKQILAIRQDGRAVLATGRIAAHCVGNEDVETVGQYLQRREQLSRLADREGRPILHYRWIIVDRQESFQQTVEETQRVETEAKASGFRLIEEFNDIAVYERQ